MGGQGLPVCKADRPQLVSEVLGSLSAIQVTDSQCPRPQGTPGQSSQAGHVMSCLQSNRLEGKRDDPDDLAGEGGEAGPSPRIHRRPSP